MLCPTPMHTHTCTHTCTTIHTHSHSFASFFPPPLPWKGWRRWCCNISASSAWTSHLRIATQGSPNTNHTQFLLSKADCECPWSALQIWGSLVLALGSAGQDPMWLRQFCSGWPGKGWVLTDRCPSPAPRRAAWPSIGCCFRGWHHPGFQTLTTG